MREGSKAEGEKLPGVGAPGVRGVGRVECLLLRTAGEEPARLGLAVAGPDLGVAAPEGAGRVPTPKSLGVGGPDSGLVRDPGPGFPAPLQTHVAFPGIKGGHCGFVTWSCLVLGLCNGGRWALP